MSKRSRATKSARSMRSRGRNTPIRSGAQIIRAFIIPICPKPTGRSTRKLARRSRSTRSEEHTSELQSRPHLVCRLLLEKKKKNKQQPQHQNKHIIHNLPTYYKEHTQPSQTNTLISYCMYLQL